MLGGSEMPISTSTTPRLIKYNVELCVPSLITICDGIKTIGRSSFRTRGTAWKRPKAKAADAQCVQDVHRDDRAFYGEDHACVGSD
jgi:hypothetical protein